MQSELEALRELIRKAVTVTGAEKIRGMDGKAKSGASSAATPSLGRASSMKEVDGSASPFGSRRGSSRNF